MIDAARRHSLKQSTYCPVLACSARAITTGLEKAGTIPIGVLIAADQARVKHDERSAIQGRVRGGLKDGARMGAAMSELRQRQQIENPKLFETH